MTRDPVLFHNCDPSSPFSPPRSPTQFVQHFPLHGDVWGFLGLACEDQLSPGFCWAGTPELAEGFGAEAVRMWWQEKMWVKMQSPLELNNFIFLKKTLDLK